MLLLLLISFSVSIVFLPSTHPHSQCQRSGSFHPSLGTSHHPLSRRKRGRKWLMSCLKAFGNAMICPCHQTNAGKTELQTKHERSRNHKSVLELISLRAQLRSHCQWSNRSESNTEILSFSLSTANASQLLKKF